jgi:hypothetical protein
MPAADPSDDPTVDPPPVRTVATAANALGTGPIHNRVRAVMIHSKRYAFYGVLRLAVDVGVSLSTLKRLLRGDSPPSFRVALAITKALSNDLGRKLDCTDLFSLDGQYPTERVCDLVGCRGCLPEEAYDRYGNLLAEYRSMKPGDWSKGASSPAPTAASNASTKARKTT